MSKIVVNLEGQNQVRQNSNAPDFSKYQETGRSGTFKKILKVLGIFIGLIVLLGSIAGFFYWQYLKTTPQYSLALLVDAARNKNQDQIENLVDYDAVVEEFVPQIIDKAVELYGRGLPEETVQQAKALATPILPVVKQRAKAELPKMIRQKTKSFEDVPFWAIAAGAGRYLDIRKEGDKAFVKSTQIKRPLEVVMQQKENGRWKIVELKDEKLAQTIARNIGQEIIGLAKNRSSGEIEQMGKDLGLEGVEELLEKAKEIFK